MRKKLCAQIANPKHALPDPLSFFIYYMERRKGLRTHCHTHRVVLCSTWSWWRKLQSNHMN